MFRCLSLVCVCVCRTGVLLISLALCADAAIGNVQEKAMKLHNGSNSEMVPYLCNWRKRCIKKKSINAEGVALLVNKTRLLCPMFACENCYYPASDVTDWSHVVLTGVVLVLHWFCLHTDRPALCGWTRSSSGILLRGTDSQYTIRQDAPFTLCGWGCLLHACIFHFKLQTCCRNQIWNDLVVHFIYWL